jgi:uroporphyrinogen-III synthase
MIDWNLQGKRIAVPEMRELEVFSSLLERRGAEVLRCPLVTIYDTPHSAAVLAFAVQLADGGFDDFVLITGEGLTRILSCIDKHDPALKPRFIEGLRQVRTITRGPKPARALRGLGLKATLEASEPTTDGVIKSLSAHELGGRRVAVQLYGNDPNLTLIRFLRDRHAEITTVAPYVYGNAADDATVHALLEKMAAGQVDAIAFTSKLQIERLVTQHPAPLVRRALSRTMIAAVGPIVAEAIRSHGFEVASSPEHSWFMKPLVVALSEQLGAKKDRDLSGLA